MATPADLPQIMDRAALGQALIQARAETFARQITAEVGKTIRQARKGVARCINTLKLSAEEARRGAGEVIPFDAYAGSENRMGWFTRDPLGIILAITPFNDPLNLVAHKLGPAISVKARFTPRQCRNPSRITPPCGAKTQPASFASTVNKGGYEASSASQCD